MNWARTILALVLGVAISVGALPLIVFIVSTSIVASEASTPDSFMGLMLVAIPPLAVFLGGYVSGLILPHRISFRSPFRAVASSPGVYAGIGFMWYLDRESAGPNSGTLFLSTMVVLCAAFASIAGVIAGQARKGKSNQAL